jgi:hypothetical protein
MRLLDQRNCHRIGDNQDFSSSISFRTPLITEHFWKNQELKALLFRGEFAAFLSF